MAQGICSVDICEEAVGPKSARGLCGLHYQRWRLTGTTDPPVIPTTEERFWRKVQKTDGCWVWTGGTACGYGYFRFEGRAQRAHRLAYQWLVGPIPEGLTLDHRCHNEDPACAGGETCPHRRCVNPAHLQPVTQLVNSLRGRSPLAINARKTHCPQGHPYDEANTWVQPSNHGRRCRQCMHNWFAHPDRDCCEQHCERWEGPRDWAN